ncbi:MAG: hypothetical protein SPL30_03070 [Succinivibrio sp.]|jgi:hypothetical protein|nr:hypothetical protein [Succinivibrio sp.]
MKKLLGYSAGAVALAAAVWAGGVAVSSALSGKILSSACEQLTAANAAKHEAGTSPLDIKVEYRKESGGFFSEEGWFVLSSGDQDLATRFPVTVSHGFLSFDAQSDCSAVIRKIFPGAVLPGAAAEGDLRVKARFLPVDVRAEIKGSGWYSKPYLEILGSKEGDRKPLEFALTLRRAPFGRTFVSLTGSNVVTPFGEASYVRIASEAGEDEPGSASLAARNINFFSRSSGIGALDMRFNLEKSRTGGLTLVTQTQASSSNGSGSAVFEAGPFSSEKIAKAKVKLPELLTDPRFTAKYGAADLITVACKAFHFDFDYDDAGTKVDYTMDLTGQLSHPASKLIFESVDALTGKVDITWSGVSDEELSKVMGDISSEVFERQGDTIHTFVEARDGHFTFNGKEFK